MAGIFNYLFENIDDIAVGRYLTDISLGIYQMAYKIASLPITEITSVINRVALPIFVNFNDDKQRLKKAYIKSAFATLLIVVPIGIILYYFPYSVVKFILGEKWLVAVEIIRIMAFFGVIRAISISTYPVFLALKRQDIVTKITGVNILFLTISLLFLVKSMGVIGAGVSAIIGALAGAPMAVYYLIKVLK